MSSGSSNESNYIKEDMFIKRQIIQFERIEECKESNISSNKISCQMQKNSSQKKSSQNNNSSCQNLNKSSYNNGNNSNFSQSVQLNSIREGNSNKSVISMPYI